ARKIGFVDRAVAEPAAAEGRAVELAADQRRCGTRISTVRRLRSVYETVEDRLLSARVRLKERAAPRRAERRSGAPVLRGPVERSVRGENRRDRIRAVLSAFKAIDHALRAACTQSKERSASVQTELRCRASEPRRSVERAPRGG